MTYKLNYEGATEPFAVVSVTTPGGAKTTAPTPAPERDDYTFGGWFKEAACLNEFNFTTTKVAEDITLFAKWSSS